MGYDRRITEDEPKIYSASETYPLYDNPRDLQRNLATLLGWKITNEAANLYGAHPGMCGGNYMSDIGMIPAFGRSLHADKWMFHWWAVRMGCRPQGNEWSLSTKIHLHTFYASDDDDFDDEAVQPLASAFLESKVNKVGFRLTSTHAYATPQCYVNAHVMLWALLWKQENGGLCEIPEYLRVR